ncbi:hypothetical protein CRG98_040926 [Punica granatum]|uniref:RNase H type-1 domain-containing protein n=1 Tax=Punica granatum TaxID=22663 RepID=A0A2I0I3W5_PUNGR|nr:hypothetical protein CRG98_040926 [Punica granatum]
MAVIGFARNIGIDLAGLAELWVAQTGLELARALGYHKVILEVDSELVRRFVTRPGQSALHISPLVEAIKGLINRSVVHQANIANIGMLKVPWKKCSILGHSVTTTRSGNGNFRLKLKLLVEKLLSSDNEFKVASCNRSKVISSSTSPKPSFATTSSIALQSSMVRWLSRVRLFAVEDAIRHSNS